MPESVFRDVLGAVEQTLANQDDPRLKRLAKNAGRTLDQFPHRLSAEKMEEILEDTFAGVAVSGDLRDVDTFVQSVVASELPPEAKKRITKKVRTLEARLIGTNTGALGRRGVEVDLSDGGLTEELLAAQEASRELTSGLELLESQTATDVAGARFDTLLGP